MNSLESLYSLTSRQSSSSKHPKAGGQMHSSHSTLMNYATPLRRSHFTLLLTSDKAKPNPKPSWSTGLPYFGNVDCQCQKSIVTQTLICLLAVAKVESQAARTTSVTETVSDWMTTSLPSSTVAEPESIQTSCPVRTTLNPSVSR